MDAVLSTTVSDASSLKAESRAPQQRTILFAILAAVLTFVMMREQVIAVWQTGGYIDTDDAMHMVQVRALLDGQNWFDMTVPRMDPPIGTFMHWSRLVDVPVAALIGLFRLDTDIDTAERLARLTFPFALIVALNLAMARLAARLLGPDARLPAMVATMLSGSGIIQFLPGRIDHHAPQIVILVVMLGSAIASLNRSCARQAVVVGLLSGLSLAINLENLPFLVILGAGLVGHWIWTGEAADRALGWYAGGLLIGLPILFIATVGPTHYLAPVCDAYGAAHLGAGLIGASGLACAAVPLLHLQSCLKRALFAGAVASTALLFVALAYPNCLHSPFAGVDPVVKEIWLSRVEESLPFLRLARHDSSEAIFSIVPVLLGLAGCLLAALQGPAPQRRSFQLVAAVIAGGLALAFWQVRVFSSVTAIALCGGLYAAQTSRDHCLYRKRETLASLSLLLIFPFTATAVSLVLPSQAAVLQATAKQGSTSAPSATAAQCLAPSAFAPLRSLQGAAIAPVDAGSYLLVHTDLDVFASAFHRDNDGNRFAFDTMLAPAREAARLAARRDVAFILICPGLPETEVIARRAPTGLAADLLGGRIPEWLTPVPLPDTPFRVFKVSSRGAS